MAILLLDKRQRLHNEISKRKNLTFLYQIIQLKFSVCSAVYSYDLNLKLNPLKKDSKGMHLTKKTYITFVRNESKFPNTTKSLALIRW